MSPTLRDLVTSARTRLAAAGVDPNEAAMDSALLARHQLGWDLGRFVAHETDPPPAGFPAAYDGLVARRAAREPVSVIIGRREFWGLDFEVTPAVLAPRPETELIVETALATVGPGLVPARTLAATRAAPAAPLFVDVGTGSGCLAISLAREFPSARVVATDISAAALEIAGRNAARLGVWGRLSLLQTSLLAAVDGPAVLVVSNPPYVPSADIATLPPEVRDWEPRAALDGGADGLDIVRALLDDAPRVLAPHGWLIMEFGYGQEDGVREAVARSALQLVAIRCDLQQVPRTLVARSG
jgi:release factor glutamine methyltransferase